ncbi:MAG: hypothetical protein ACLTT1_19870 [[Clostridium] scindens]
MVEETIKTIKETENEAEEIVRKADAECTGILEEASAKAKEIKEHAEADAKAKAEASLDVQQRNCGQKTTMEALAEVETQIASLREAALAKEDDDGICGDRRNSSDICIFRTEKNKRKGGMRLWQFCRCKELVSAR